MHRPVLSHFDDCHIGRKTIFTVRADDRDGDVVCLRELGDAIAWNCVMQWDVSSARHQCCEHGDYYAGASAHGQHDSRAGY